MRIDVGRAQSVHESLGIIFPRRARILNYRKSLRPALADDCLYLFADLRIGLIPADRLELAGFVFFQRIGEAVGRIGNIGVTVATCTERPLAIRMALIAYHFVKLAIDHIGSKAAFGRASVAQGVSGGGRPALSLLGLRLLPRSEAQELRPGKRRRHTCASGQKTSPRNSVF